MSVEVLVAVSTIGSNIENFTGAYTDPRAILLQLQVLPQVSFQWLQLLIDHCISSKCGWLLLKLITKLARVTSGLIHQGYNLQ